MEMSTVRQRQKTQHTVKLRQTDQSYPLRTQPPPTPPPIQGQAFTFVSH